MDINTDNGFTEYRYFKPKTHRSSKIALKIEVDFKVEAQHQMKFSFAVCSDEDNFSRVTARNLLDQRMDDQDILVGEYDHTQHTLVEAAMVIVDKVLENDGVVTHIPASKLRNLKNLKSSFHTITELKRVEGWIATLDIDAQASIQVC